LCFKPCGLTICQVLNTLVLVSYLLF
jgi:hypothetical protein